MNHIVRAGLLVPVALAVPACQSPSTGPDTVFLEAAQIPATPEPVVKEVEVPVATPQLRPLPGLVPKADDGAAAPEQILAEATRQATQGPTPDGFIEAVQTYDYLPGAVYEVYASPGHVTTLALRPGERLIAKAAGDTARWIVSDSHTGPGTPGSLGRDTRTLLLVKPLKPGIETNLVVSTDERVYQIDLKSVPGAYHSEVRWNYPHDFALQLARHHREQAAGDDEVLDAAVDLTRLDFGYRIRSIGRGQTPGWTPRRAFTDGRKTYIAFPDDLATMEAPPLFVLGRKGDRTEAQLVNYRVRGNYYIVDRVVTRAELRLGESPQQVVRIERRR